MKEAIAYGLFGIAAYALSIIFVGGTLRRMFLKDKMLLALVGGAFVMGWPLLGPAAVYVSLRRMFMLSWMCSRFEDCSRMDWNGCWDAAVAGFDQQQEWGDLSLFPNKEWTREGARSLADEEMSVWDGD